MSYDSKDPKQNWLPGYLREIADRFGLKDWAITIDAESPANPKVSASIGTIYGRKVALIYIQDTFWDKAGDEQRQTILHELTHCHFSDADHWAGGEMKKTAYRAFDLMFERGVDGIADGVAPLMPLPPKIKK